MIDDIKVGLSTSIIDVPHFLERLARKATKDRLIYPKSIISKKGKAQLPAYFEHRLFQFKGKRIFLQHRRNPTSYWLDDVVLNIKISQFYSWLEFQMWLLALMGPFYRDVMEGRLFGIDPYVETLDYDYDYTFRRVIRKHSIEKKFKTYPEAKL